LSFSVVNFILVLRVEATGKEYILECNSSAIGLNGRHQEEDDKHIRDLVLRKMEAARELKRSMCRGEGEEETWDWEAAGVGEGRQA
jgi:hypothetical protein